MEKNDSCPNIQPWRWPWQKTPRSRTYLSELLMSASRSTLRVMQKKWSQINLASLSWHVTFFTTCSDHQSMREDACQRLSVHSSGFGSDELSVMSCEIPFYKSDRVHHMLTTDKLLQGKWSHPHIIQNPFDFLPWNTKGEFLKKLAALFNVSEMGSGSVKLKLQKNNN